MQVTIQGASAHIVLAVQRDPNGGVSLCVVSCKITVRQVDFSVSNGGALASLANSRQIKVHPHFFT